MFRNLKFLLIPLAFLALPFWAKAACTTNTAIDFIARDPSGAYIPNVKVDVYKQDIDANGHPKPTTRVDSGSTGNTLGIAQLSFRNPLDSDTYAIRAQSVLKDNASFWFYGTTLACGDSTTIEKTLSGISLTLHDAAGSILSNTNFNVYSQLYDDSGHPLESRREMLLSSKTDYAGQANIYLPQGSASSIDNSLSDHYTLEISRSAGKFYFYNIPVVDGQITNLDYYLSALRIRLQDSSGAAYPSGTAIEVYSQLIDADNNPVQGTKIGSFTIGSNGYGNFEVSSGLYALGVKGKTGEYEYFWNIEAEDGRMSEYTLVPASDWTPSTGTCQTALNLYLNLRDYTGNYAAGLKFELYEQTVNGNGLPVAGAKVGGGTVDNSGAYTLTFKPDPRKSYALKVYDKKADLGEFWFYDAIRFVCGFDRTITKNIQALRIVLRDTKGELKRNYNFSLYLQTYDADNNPVIDSKKLITSLQTDTGGSALVYVSPYNTYGAQSGIYALSLKNSNNNIEQFYNIKINADKDSEFEVIASGLSGILQDASGRILAEKSISLYEQKVNEGHFVLGEKLLSLKTDAAGEFQFEYPAGKYAFVSIDDLKRNNVFWNISISPNNNYQKLSTSLINFNLTDPQGKGLVASPSLILYTLVGEKGVYTRDKQISTIKLINGSASLSLAAGKYLAYYSGTGGQLFGQAFYVKNGAEFTVNIALNSKYLITNTKSFSLPGADSSIAPVAPITPSGTGISSSLTSRLRGRILLQVQDKGQAWYVNPSDSRRYSLGRPEDAYNLMRRFALGVSNSDFAAMEKNPQGWSQLAGRILLKPNDNGRAYYFDPVQLKLYYLGRPQDAFNIMRERGLGITNSDLTKIQGAE